MNLKFFPLILAALLFTSCEDRAKEEVKAKPAIEKLVKEPTCDDNNSLPQCDMDNDGIINSKDSNPKDFCIPNANPGTCDLDGDGLTNDKEKEMGTDKNKKDTDGDGLEDGDAKDTDPKDFCVPDATPGTCDLDGDGLTNAEEDAKGTDKTKKDTDGDGLEDADPADTDPLDICAPKDTFGPCDPDKDGLSNDAEDAAKTDKANPDTDGDGVKDGAPTEKDPMDPCLPLQAADYTDYNNTNAIWLADDCDADGYGNKAEDNAGDILSSPYDYNASCFMFEDKKYCETKLDEIWLDRNLGASAKCDGVVNNAECYGDYYQWGRMRDGHEKEDSVVISNISAELGDNLAIYKLNSNKDWNTHTDASGSERAAVLSADNNDLLCPKGWRVPESDLLLAAGNVALDIPLAGYRAGQNGLLRRENAALWSASIKDTNAILFYDENNVVDLERTNAVPVRCVKVK